VFVFTPKGEVVTLTAGSTPVDFAYSIHTEVGHRCVGAKVNGRLVALSEQLHSGDTVEVFTSKLEGAGPSRDWLGFVATPRAASKIKQWFSRERREDSIAAGQDAVGKAMRREGLPVQKIAAGKVLATVAEQLNYTDLNALYAAVGENHVSAKSIASRVAKALNGEGPAQAEENLPVTARRPARRPGSGPIGVHVEGLDDVLVRLARCCTPVPGDDILGFVTRGRGVSVHRGDCANAVSLAASQNDRLIDVEWDSDGDAANVVASVEIKALDRARLLSDVSAALSEHHVNILACSTSTGSDRVARLRFDFEIADPSHLTSLLRAVRHVDSVYDAYRVLPGRGG
jgi:GTP diphosphokinase / guanosine-3',5'-bis(diphosphate) 3'-diphosphatase